VDSSETKSTTAEKLDGKEELLRAASDMHLLEPFAKAYLGLYLDIDKTVPPEDRVRLLVNDNFVDCIFEGFNTTLHNDSVPTPEEIGTGMVKGERIAIGFPILAGLDRLYVNSPEEIERLSGKTLAAAICFHFANRSEIEDRWLTPMIKKEPELVAKTLCEFWLGMISAGAQYLPGFDSFLHDPGMKPFVGEILLLLLEKWSICRKKFLLILLQAALCHSDLNALYDLAVRVLQERQGQPVVLRVYWMSICFLLQPQRHEEELFDYMGRTREKAVPLMNFLVPVLCEGVPCKRRIPYSSLAYLLHMLAPKIAPHRDQFGRLEENATKVLMLFDLIREYPEDEAAEIIRKLRSIRVMRVWSEYLDEIEKSLRS
jgi:hypothetical protein